VKELAAGLVDQVSLMAISDYSVTLGMEKRKVDDLI
jgi:hypothetical protein